MDWHHPEISDAIRRALAEDIGTGDVTTEACVPAGAMAKGYFLAREPMTLVPKAWLSSQAPSAGGFAGATRVQWTAGVSPH